jgi:hypothetical protein
VIILTDRTVTRQATYTDAGLNITVNTGAFLDLSVYQFTGTLASLSGQGTLRLGNGGVSGSNIKRLLKFRWPNRGILQLI